jgi:hypothetical protein
MDLSFLIFPGGLVLEGANAEVSFNISVGVVGNVITDANGLPPSFDAGGTLRTDRSGTTTWTNRPGGENIGLPADGPSPHSVEIPLRAPTLVAFFGPNAAGNIRYDMSVTIDATAAVTGGGFLDNATANVSDPLMPGMTDAIASATFTPIPEPSALVLAIFGLIAFGATRLRHFLRQTA